MAKSSQAQKHSLRKIKYMQSQDRIGLVDWGCHGRKLKSFSSFRARKNYYCLKFEDYSP